MLKESTPFQGKPVILLENLTKRFGPKILFEDVSMQFDPGKRYGLTGANGAGKSTLLKMLAGEEDSDTGSISIPRSAGDPRRVSCDGGANEVDAILLDRLRRYFERCGFADRQAVWPLLASAVSRLSVPVAKECRRRTRGTDHSCPKTTEVSPDIEGMSPADRPCVHSSLIHHLIRQF